MSDFKRVREHLRSKALKVELMLPENVIGSGSTPACAQTSWAGIGQEFLSSNLLWRLEPHLRNISILGMSSQAMIDGHFLISQPWRLLSFSYSLPMRADMLMRALMMSLQI